MSHLATFAAGCFWGIEEIFRVVPGVLETQVGYMGGHTENPTYKQVCTDETGHAEVVQVTYDPKLISYADLLDIFWENHNPTLLNRQGPDVGSQYRSAIFYHDAAQQKEAVASKLELSTSAQYSKPIVTQIVPAATFYPAEEYHQKYLQKQGSASCQVNFPQGKGN